jgi:ATP-binding cassette subfamily C (CFTR/MRP) protein 1
MVHVHHGDILIGDQSIFGLDIQKLRLQFGVVPQSPYLFEGTLASNLDRGRVLQNSQLQKALAAVGLSYSIDHPVTEGGHNLSVGERQLICLARVIASDRSIILMDEPTSGLDPETDARINWILQTVLKSKTVLTIAHRWESIKNYDLIVEMAGGRLQSERTPV